MARKTTPSLTANQRKAQDPATPADVLHQLSHGPEGKWVAANPNTPINTLIDPVFLRKYLVLVEENPIWALFQLENPLAWTETYLPRLDEAWIDAAQPLPWKYWIILFEDSAKHMYPHFTKYPVSLRMLRARMRLFKKFIKNQQINTDELLVEDNRLYLKNKAWICHELGPPYRDTSSPLWHTLHATSPIWRALRIQRNLSLALHEIRSGIRGALLSEELHWQADQVRAIYQKHPALFPSYEDQ